jgi:hypothetical protein
MLNSRLFSVLIKLSEKPNVSVFNMCFLRICFSYVSLIIQVILKKKKKKSAGTPQCPCGLALTNVLRILTV